MDEIITQDTVQEEEADLSDLFYAEYIFIAKDSEGVEIRRETAKFFFSSALTSDQIDNLVNKAYMQWIKDGLGEGSGYSFVSMEPVEEYFYDLSLPTT